MARKEPTPVQGFVPIRGNKARQAVNINTGEVISLRQYQKLQNQQLTPEERVSKQVIREANKERKGRDYYKQEITIFMDSRNKQLANAGLPMYTKRSEVVRSDEFKAYYQAVKPPSKNMNDEQKKKFNAKDGKKAKALVAIGLRAKDADYPVGESPTAT